MIIALVILLLLFLVPDLYIWLTQLRPNYAWPWQLLHWLPTLSVLVAILATLLTGRQMTLFSYVLTVLLLLVLPKLAFILFSLAHLPRVGLALALVIMAAMLYGRVAGWRQLVTTPVTIHCGERLPESFRGYRIAHISDLHVGTFGTDTTHVRRIVEHVNALQPDLIVFTGDIVNLSPDELTPFLTILSQLRAPDGVMAVLGNHDYCLYASDHSPAAVRRNVARLCQMERSMGWQLLMNEHRTLHRGADSLHIIGVENVGLPPFPSRGDLTAAAASLPATDFKVLLSHDPTHWRREVLSHPAEIDLTLSGHTHAMQLRLFGLSPSRLAYREWGGLYTEASHDTVPPKGVRGLFVCTGTGGNIPFRLGAWPEVALLTLDR